MVDSSEMEQNDIAQNSIAKYFQPIKKRKPTDDSPKVTKLSKTETIEENEKKELEDAGEGGLETLYSNSLVGFAHVLLSNISISPEMQVKVNNFRVMFSKSSMKKRYDPSKAVLVICPEQDGTHVDVRNVKDMKFFVVQKVHCLRAFQEFDQSGDFVKMTGHHKRNVLYYVLNTSSAEMIQYGNLHENFISDQFARKMNPQDLLHYFHCLTMKDSTVKSLKVVERMSKLCRIGVDESTALRKLCKWKSPGFAALIQVLVKFEKYETKDLKRLGHQQRLARGEKLSMSNVLLKSLAMCSEDYFLANYEEVLGGSISLKDLAENFKLVTDVGKVYKVLVLMAGEDSVETMKGKYPGKFEFDAMKPFVGAVFNGKVKNMKAVLLENYYISVVSATAEGVKNPVEFVSYQTVGEVFGDEMNKYDMIVFNIGIMNKEICKEIIQTVLGGDKVFHAALIVFPSEIDNFEVLSYLRSQQAATSLVKDFQLVPLLFQKVATANEPIGENVSYALLFGKLTILKAPLLVCYSDISQLVKVVESVCPPQLSVALISDPGVPLIKLHSADLDRKVTYLVVEADVSKFRKKLDSDKSPAVKVSSDEPEDPHVVKVSSDEPADSEDSRVVKESSDEPANSEDIATTSPIKSTSKTLDDSGFVETQQLPPSSAVKSFLSEMSEIEAGIYTTDSFKCDNLCCLKRQ